jgi:hypothetical protein
MGVRSTGHLSSEFTIFGDYSFIHRGEVYSRHHFNGRCYRVDLPSGIHANLKRKKGEVAYRRIPAALYSQLLSECEARISEAETEGANPAQAVKDVAATVRI